MPPATRNKDLLLVLRLCVVMKAHEILVYDVLQKGSMCG